MCGSATIKQKNCKSPVKSDGRRGEVYLATALKCRETRDQNLNLHTPSTVDAISALITVTGSRVKASQQGALS
jgi:hypothetical protein